MVLALPLSLLSSTNAQLSVPGGCPTYHVYRNLAQFGSLAGGEEVGVPGPEERENVEAWGAQAFQGLSVTRLAEAWTRGVMAEP